MKFILILFFVFALVRINAQNACGFDQVHRELLQINQSYKKSLDDFEYRRLNNLSNYKKRGGVYQIPIVVHVMETKNSLTNITDEEIRNGIKYLNHRYRKIAGSRGDGKGVDVQIEFVLAVQDENGNCTTGINRFDMSKNALYMSNGVKASSSGVLDSDVKSQIVWNPKKYYNIWAVSEIDDNNGGSGIQGYAYFASAHGASFDGTIIICNALKSPESETLTHELGHAFNLYHTFEGNKDNAGNKICPSNTNCATDGDKVCDTPPHKETMSQWCDVVQNECDNNSSSDLVFHNYMSYTYGNCKNEFTQGQKDRVKQALFDYRSSYLAENGNLSLVPPANDLKVDFSVSMNYACPNSIISLTNSIACFPNTYLKDNNFKNISFLWTIKSGNITLTSTDQNPDIKLVTPGLYDITLTITTPKGNFSTTKPGVIIIGSSPINSCSPTIKNADEFGLTISNVKFNTIDNDSKANTNDPSYVDYTCSKTTIVEAGKTYPLNVTVNGSFDPEYMEAYIDYDNNGKFDDIEKVGYIKADENVTKIFTGNITIPVSAVQETPLRFRVFGNNQPITAGMRSCKEDFDIGEIEDYTVYVSGKTAGVSIAADPSNIITYGTPVSFTATIQNGGSTPVFQWYLNGVLLSSEHGYTFTSSTLVDGDVIKCVMISNLPNVVNSPATSNEIVMKVTGTPISDFESVSTVICSNAPVSFKDLSKLFPSSWNWNFEGGNPTTSTAQNPTVSYANPGTYKVTLTASNANGTGTVMSKPAYITVSASATAACNTFTRSSSPVSTIGISSVKLNDLVNNTSTEDAVYQDYSCTKKTILEPNKSYDFTIGCGSGDGKNKWVKFLIDYNADGDFDDAGELIYSSNDKSEYTSSFVTPMTPVYDKLLRMRIMSDFGSPQNAPCGKDYSFGQVEDYSVIFESPCTKPNPPVVVITQPTCEDTKGYVSVTSTINGLTFSIDGKSYVAYTSPFQFPANTNYEISAMDSKGCKSSAVIGKINDLPGSLSATFQQIAPICSGEALLPLPVISMNNVKGKWSPVLDNTKTTTYTFTPDAGQCVSSTTMEIIVNPKYIPTFEKVNPICKGDNLFSLPTSSLNGIIGSWSPVINNQVTTNYTFTPNSGTCVDKVTMSITVLTVLDKPSFNQVADICYDAVVAPLPMKSLNDIVGTWSPSINNRQTTIYTFTPDAGQCASKTEMTINVNTRIDANFNIVDTICYGANLGSLPTKSLNNILGIWSPKIENTLTTKYTFTPLNSFCANTYSKTINVKTQKQPLFDSRVSFCIGTKVEPLPLISKNGIKGNWTPILNNVKTTEYTFTPTAGQCAQNTTLTLNVEQLPNAGEIIIDGSNCVGRKVNATSTVIGGTWESSDKSRAYISQFGEISLLAPGTTKIIYSVNQNGCNNSAYKLINIDKCLILDDLDINGVTLFPNPTSDNINILLNQIEYQSIEIFDHVGKKVHELQVESDSIKINVSELESGIYTIKLLGYSSRGQINFVKN
ncbi:MAG: PKD domain-containing protein [Crocinitomicaceae bacterium]|nr:PKD domain-containing protein [Crocinitomicaceae bacterium]